MIKMSQIQVNRPFLIKKPSPVTPVFGSFFGLNQFKNGVEKPVPWPPTHEPAPNPCIVEGKLALDPLKEGQKMTVGATLWATFRPLFVEIWLIATRNWICLLITTFWWLYGGILDNRWLFWSSILQNLLSQLSGATDIPFLVYHRPFWVWGPEIRPLWWIALRTKTNHYSIDTCAQFLAFFRSGVLDDRVDSLRNML